MQTKYIFPNDWDSLTDIQTLQMVEYLCKNYSKYKIDIIAADEIHIGKNIVMTCENFGEQRTKSSSFIINGRSFDFDYDKKIAYDLFVACKNYKAKTLQKLYERKQNKK